MEYVQRVLKDKGAKYYRELEKFEFWQSTDSGVYVYSEIRGNCPRALRFDSARTYEHNMNNVNLRY